VSEEPSAVAAPHRLVASPTPVEATAALRLSAAEHRRLARRRYLRQSAIGYLFILPNLVFFLVFLVYPLLSVIPLSFESGGIISPPQWVGLANWRAILADPVFREVIGNTFAYSAMAISAVFIISFGLALLLARLQGPSVGLIRAALYFPTLTPVVVAALIWNFVVQPDFGILNVVTHALGLGTTNWLGNTQLVLPAIAMLEVWRGVGFWTLLYLAAIVGLPRDLFYAAQLDGATAWQRFIHLTLPLLRPTFIFAVVWATIANLQLFDSVFILTDGGPGYSSGSIVWYVYRMLFQFNMAGVAASMSLVLLFITFVLVVVELKLLRMRGR
jgi:ABC-type sugar transport system permease subunit